MSIVTTRKWFTADALKMGLMETSITEEFIINLVYKRNVDKYVVITWTEDQEVSRKHCYYKAEKHYNSLRAAQNYYSRMLRQHHAKRIKYGEAA